MLIGNKTIEVGLDFKDESAVTRLIFSAHNLSEFLQRIGRLRNTIKGLTYKAICFTSQNVANEFEGVDTMTREELHELIKSCMKDSKLNKNFRQKYGYLEALEYSHKFVYGFGIIDIKNCHFYSNTGGVTSDKKEKHIEQLVNLIKGHYSVETKIDKFNKYDHQMLDVMEELANFRGSSLNAMYYYPQRDEFGSYNITSLMRWAYIEIVDKRTFKRRVPKKYHDKIDDDNRAICCVLISGILHKPRFIKMVGSSEPRKDFGKEPKSYSPLYPQIVNEKSEINFKIRDIFNKECIHILCMYLPLRSQQCKELYGLDDYMALIPYKDGCLAIGIDALYAYCELKSK